ncbi:T9SS type A sorting domain-containing protein [Chryseobacterium sp. LAM-KRS1]|uniref:T9SS type A sorting domain-containing protein n=1 Tax=Chryseobacterium sp. LAM-KRS1 TaxID=2715754 RepID=UPI00155269C3|nr:T9SS type A sorting domain-containing protein [Chryseobacterium sp. LAM-KRS1]
MKKLLLTCMMALGIGASAQILVNEGFEGSSLPSGWASTTTGSGTSSTPGGYGTSAGTACVGSKAVYKNIYGSTYTGWNLTYSSTTSNATALTYSFKYLAKGYSTSGAVSGSVAADYSVDGGTTWVDILAPVVLDSPNGTPIPCTTVSGTIPAGTIPTGASFKFRLKSTSTSTGDFYMGFDDVQLAQTLTNAPSCTQISAPADAATGISVTPTITWASAAFATGYTLNIGTTAGGTDVVNGLDVGAVTSYTIPNTSALNYSTLYYVTVIPKNNIGSATGCTSTSFTTRAVVCPTVSAPSAGAIGQPLTPTITWGAVNSATGYKLTVGTTPGGTDILNNLDLGNVTTYTFTTPLALSSTYYYTVNSYSPTSTSSSCTERSFSTICGPTNIPYSQNFESVSTPALPACTSIENAGNGNNWTTYSSAGGGFNTKVLNYTYNSSNAANAWFYTQGINLTGGVSYRIKYIYGNASGTTYPEKLKVAYGTAESSASMTNVLADYPNVTNGTTPISATVDFVPAASGVYYFGFNAYSDADMNRLYVDNIVIDATPTCAEPSALVVSNVAATTATISWTAPATVPAGGYEYYYSTSNTAPTATTPASGTSTTVTADLNNLTAATVYYVWVRSVCSSSDKSAWSQLATFTTACITSQTLTENFDSTAEGSLPPCWTSIGSTVSYAKVMAYTSANTGAIISGANALYLYTSGSSTGMLATPEIANLQSNNYILKFKARANYTAGGVVQIGYLTDPANTSTFVVLGTYTSTSVTVADDYQLSITGVPAGVNKLVFKHTGTPANSVLIDDISYMLDPSLGTSEVANAKNTIKVYPNPFADVLNISDVSKVKSVSVSDVAGRLVKTIANPTSVLQLGELNSGMYLITLELKDGSKQTIKTIKK